MSDNRGWNWWVWEQSSWRVLAHYPTRAEAMAAARHAADPHDTWLMCPDGGVADEFMRAHCTERSANSVATADRGRRRKHG